MCFGLACRIHCLSDCFDANVAVLERLTLNEIPAERSKSLDYKK